MPNFDPAQALPDELEPTVQTVPLSLTAGGQGYTGAPLPNDPAQVQAERDALTSRAISAHAELAAFNQANPGLGGVTGHAPPAAAPPALALATPPPAPVSPPVAAPPSSTPGGQRPPMSAPAAPGGPPLGELMAAATAPPDPNGDAVDQELAAARAPAAGAARPGDLAAGDARARAAEQGQEGALAEQGRVEAADLGAERQAKEQQAREAADKLRQQETDRQQADLEIRKARDEAAKRPFHTFWSDKTAGQKILAMIGIVLGGFSWDPKNRNEAVDIVNASIARDFEKQKEEHAQLWKDVDTAMQQGQALRSNQLQEMSAFRLNQALKLEAVIAKGSELSAGAKNAVGIATLKANNAKLGYARDQAYEEARRLAAAAEETARHNRAEEAVQRGHLAVSRAAGKRAADADQDEKVIKLAKRAFPGSTEALKAVKSATEAEGLIEELKKNPSALAQSLSTERLASVFGGGGKPSVAVLHMIDPNATSWAGLAQDKISKAFTGNSGDAIRKNLIRMAADERDHAVEVREGHRAKGAAALKGLAKHAPEAVDNYLNGIFGEARAPAAAAPVAPADAAAIAWAKGHAGDPRAARILQLHGM